MEFINLHTLVICHNPIFGRVRMTLTLPKWGLGSLPRLLKLQSLIVGVKKIYIGIFFISLKSYRSADVKNGLG
jgi:hypothetical protein